MYTKIKNAVLLSLFVVLTFSILANIPTVIAPMGPRTEDLIIRFYSDVPATYAALKVGDIDLMAFTGWSVGLPAHDGKQFDSDLYMDAIADPNIQLAPIMGNDIVAFDFNNNCTMDWYPGIRSPMNYRDFRVALAHLVDKDYYVNSIKDGFACRIDVPIPCTQSGWWNTSLTGVNYPYPYDSCLSEGWLDGAGFDQGSTPNPHYDALFPCSAQFIRVYPPDHQLAGQDLHPLIFKHRADDYMRHYAAYEFMSNIRKMGIPVIEEIVGKEQANAQVMQDRNYHIYTSGWVVKKWPIYLYHLYYGDYWFPGGSNYVTGRNCTGGHNFPRIDEALEELWHSQDYTGAQDVCKKAQSHMIQECISVWLWSSQSYVAYSNLLGTVNMEGYGLVNKYTFWNTYRVDGSPIVVGLADPPIQLNVMYSSWIYDWLCLDRIYTHLINEPPYDLSADQPWLAKDWLIETWIDPQDGREKTKVTYWLNSDAWWVEPVTGNMHSQVTAHDIEFSIWMAYALDDCWHYPDVRDVHHTRILDSHTIEVYFNTNSYWAVYWIGEELPIIPKYLWIQNFCIDEYHAEILDRPYVPCEKFQLPIPTIVQTIQVWLDGIPLVEGVDYNLVAKDGCHNWIHWLIPANPGQLLEILYFTPLIPAHGYIPGGFAWEEKLVGCGMYYVVDLVPGVGGHIALKKNQFFFLETPALGEVDFVVKSNGCYKVDIFDVVLAAGAYGSQGSGIPSTNWFPGADLAPVECKIDIFDIVTITGQYGREWGCDP